VAGNIIDQHRNDILWQRGFVCRRAQPASDTEREQRGSATRPSITAPDVSSGEPSSSRDDDGGHGPSTQSSGRFDDRVSLSKRLMPFEVKGRRSFRPPISRTPRGASC